MLGCRSARTSAGPDRDNAIDVYISDDFDEVLADGAWQRLFTRRPEPLTREEKRAYLDGVTGVALGSDAFFPSATTSSAPAAAA